MNAILTQSPSRPSEKLDRQKNFIRWMINTVQNSTYKNPQILINASNRVN